MNLPVVSDLLRPAVRFLVGLIAVPLFRLFLRCVLRLHEVSAELEKDLEQWFRASLVLLIATRNMEESLFGWVPPDFQGEGQWVTVMLRVLLALGVVQSMPDQELFAVSHPGPPRLRFTKGRPRWPQLKAQTGPLCKGLLWQHLSRSSPMLAIMAALAPGWIGWLCYGTAVAQYLIIGLVTSRDQLAEILVETDAEATPAHNEPTSHGRWRVVAAGQLDTFSEYAVEGPLEPSLQRYGQWSAEPALAGSADDLLEARMLR